MRPVEGGAELEARLAADHTTAGTAEETEVTAKYKRRSRVEVWRANQAQLLDRFGFIHSFKRHFLPKAWWNMII